MQIYPHGGSCCGIKHMRGFLKSMDKVYPPLIEEQVKAARKDDKRRGIIIEIVLRDDQVVNMPLTVKAMKRLGFKQVTRFQNKNSNNLVNIFHCFTGDEKHYLKDSPYRKKQKKA